jgi:hypothetical protein
MDPKRRREYDLFKFNLRKRSCEPLGKLVDCLAVGLDPVALKSCSFETRLEARRKLLRKAELKIGHRPRNFGEWQRALVNKCKIVVFSAERNFEVCFGGESAAERISKP